MVSGLGPDAQGRQHKRLQHAQGKSNSKSYSSTCIIWYKSRRENMAIAVYTGFMPTIPNYQCPDFHTSWGGAQLYVRGAVCYYRNAFLQNALRIREVLARQVSTASCQLQQYLLRAPLPASFLARRTLMCWCCLITSAFCNALDCYLVCCFCLLLLSTLSHHLYSCCFYFSKAHRGSELASLCPVAVSEEATDVPWAYPLGHEEPEEPQQVVSVLPMVPGQFLMLLACPRWPGPTATLLPLGPFLFFTVFYSSHCGCLYLTWVASAA